MAHFYSSILYASLKHNALDFNTAISMIEKENYKLLKENASGTQTYVKHINNIATSEYIDVNYSERWAIKSVDTFNDKDISSFAMPVHEPNIDMHKGNDIIISGNIEFSKTDEKILNIVMKVNS